MAALAVFLFHYGYFNPDIRLDLSVPLIGKALQFPLGLGFAGVDLFFVLSGFLLALPFAHARQAGLSPPDLRRYFKRRVLRVFPAYYAQLVLLALLGAWFVAWKPLDWPALLAHLVMFFNIGPAPVRPLVGIWWTLPVEFSFYLLLPLLALLMRPRYWLLLLAAGIALSVLYRLWVVQKYVGLGGQAVVLTASQLPGTLPEFMLGASGAVWVHYARLRARARSSPLLLDCLFVFSSLAAAAWLWGVVLSNGGVYWQGHWSMVIAPFALGVPLSLMVLSLYLGSRVGKALLANRPVHFLGLVSYSLYLWHFVVLQQLQSVLGETYSGLGALPKFGLSAALVVLVAAASYWLFERPFMRPFGWPSLARARPADT